MSRDYWEQQRQQGKVEWLVSCKDPFLFIVVSAKSKEEAVTDALFDEKYENYDLAKLKNMILEGKVERCHVEQLCLPKEAKNLFAGHLITLLSKIEHLWNVKRKVTQKYLDTVYTLTNMIQKIGSFYHKDAILHIRQTAELLIENSPYSTAKEKFSGESNKFSSSPSSISDILTAAFLTDEVS
jgi:hypothetical protein